MSSQLILNVVLAGCLVVCAAAASVFWRLYDRAPSGGVAMALVGSVVVCSVLSLVLVLVTVGA